MFKRSAEFEDVFKITSFCIAHCKTINKSNISVEQSKCLGILDDNKIIVGIIEPFWELISNRFLMGHWKMQWKASHRIETERMIEY